MVDRLALGQQRLDDGLGAVGGHALLVAGDQERERALDAAGGDGLGGGGGEGGDGALHVHGAAADQDAVHDRGVERRPGVQAAASPTGTTSVWPAKQRLGRAVPQRA